ncbi:MAG TPA: DMT family transporter [Solirubrobacteraceae bacterium]|nr:DMT family transporter [Solirubrobacteraceae bacterium]
MKNRTALLALIAAGTIWGSTIALSKLSLEWLDPSWLAAMRFLVAAPVLALISRAHLRRALTPRVVVSGALGIGLTMLLQNAGIAHTSVSHAAIIVGGLPVIVAVIAAGAGHGSSRPMLWLGYGVALGGIILVARGGGGGATSGGDLLVLASTVVSAAFIAFQPLVLKGQDAGAVTAVQFAAGAAVATPVALLGGLPHAPAATPPVVAFVALALAGTVLPFWLFAHGQKGTSPELAGAMVNLEPLVGAVVGWIGFGDPCGVSQVLGAIALVAGILLSTVPWERLPLATLPRRAGALRPYFGARW